MSLKTGLAGQIGYKEESTYGTAVTVDRFLPLVSEGIEATFNRVDRAGIRAGRRVLDSDDWKATTKDIAGPVQHELTDNSMGAILKWCLGSVSSSGSAPTVHTITPSTSSGELPSFTCQVGRPDTSGTVRPFTFSGCKVTSWEIAGAVDEVATIGLDIVAQNVVSSTSLASASYGASDSPFVYTQGTVTISGATPAVVSSFTLKGENGLKVDRKTAGQATIREPLFNDFLKVSGSIDVEFESLTTWNYYEGANECDIVLGFDAGTNECLFTVHARFDKGDTFVDGRDVLMQSLEFTMVGDGSDADGITCVLKNNDSTP